jgi:hypothetical protein
MPDTKWQTQWALKPGQWADVRHTEAAVQLQADGHAVRMVDANEPSPFSISLVPLWATTE